MNVAKKLKLSKMGRHLTHAFDFEAMPDFTNNGNEKRKLPPQQRRQTTTKHIVELKEKDGEIGRIKRKVETKMKSELKSVLG